jgi:hypothetical protein
VSLRGVRHEHEYEPQYGLPERLPADEQVLWQGAPALAPMMRHVFHLRALAVYFVLMLALRAVAIWPEIQGMGDLLVQLAWAVALAGLGWGMVAVLARMTCRSAVYTITNKRVVLRVGVVLSVTFNLPLRSIASADLRPLHEGYGDIALKLAGDVRIGYVHLWPHARPWRIGAPEPMLRCLPQAQEAARVLTSAWAQANGHALQGSGHAAQTNGQVRIQNSAPANAPTSLPEGMQGAALGAPLMAPSSH